VAAARRANQQDVRLVNFDLGLLFGGHQSLVVAVHGDGQHPLGGFLADDVLVQLGNDLPRAGDLGKELLRRAPPLSLLVEDRLAELDALAADVDVAGSFDQRTNVPVALPTE
jgi:hypothetical protein